MRAATFRLRERIGHTGTTRCRGNRMQDGLSWQLVPQTFLHIRDEKRRGGKMIRKTFACLFLASLVGAAAWAQTVDELIAKNIQARGGREKLKSVQTMRMTGKMYERGRPDGRRRSCSRRPPEQDAHRVHLPGHDRRAGVRRHQRLVDHALHRQEGPRGDLRRGRQERSRSRPTSTARSSTTRRRGTRSSWWARRTWKGRRPTS